ncbi:MAG: hypothetical protein KDC92_15340 [Bacteroidetes bacterium]|nr:hypothetical protein [Bacteroidota bacterium]
MTFSKTHIAIVATLLLAATLISFKADKKVVSWNYKVECINGNEVKLTATGTITKGWHVYSVEQLEGLFAPAPSSVILVDTLNLEKKGATTSPSKIHEDWDPALEMKSKYYENEIVMEQSFNILNKTDSVRFMIEFQACDNKQCIFPFPERIALPMPEKCN